MVSWDRDAKLRRDDIAMCLGTLQICNAPSCPLYHPGGGEVFVLKASSAFSFSSIHGLHPLRWCCMKIPGMLADMGLARQKARR